MNRRVAKLLRVAALLAVVLLVETVIDPHFPSGSGNSMEPTLRDGQRSLFVRPYRSVRVGDIILLRHSGELMIKRVTETRDGMIWVLGDNREESTDSRKFGWIGSCEVVGLFVAAFPRCFDGPTMDVPDLEESQVVRLACIQEAGALVLDGRQEDARVLLQRRGFGRDEFVEAQEWARSVKKRSNRERFIREDNPFTVHLSLPNGPAKISETHLLPEGSWGEIEVVLQATAGSSCTVEFDRGSVAAVLNGSNTHIVAIPAGAESVTYTLETYGPGESIAILQVGGIGAR